MVYRHVCGFGIIINLIFVTFSIFEISHFWGINTIKVHYRAYLVRATPPTVLHRPI